MITAQEARKISEGQSRQQDYANLISEFIRSDARNGKRETIFIASEITEDDAYGAMTMLYDQGFEAEIHHNGFDGRKVGSATFYIKW